MNWLRNFLYGRHGSDALSFALMILFIILSILGQLLRWPVLYFLASVFIECFPATMKDVTGKTRHFLNSGVPSVIGSPSGKTGPWIAKPIATTSALSVNRPCGCREEREKLKSVVPNAGKPLSRKPDTEPLPHQHNSSWAKYMKKRSMPFMAWTAFSVNSWIGLKAIIFYTV